MDRESLAERMLSLIGISETLKSIGLAVWLIFGLLCIAKIVEHVRARDREKQEMKKGLDWNALVENAYDRAQYSEALEILANSQLIYPGSALIKFWQGRCHFRLEEWEKAAEKFQESCRLEPGYRKSVRDYMAFIELNELVPSVEGYLDK
jgi:tetratricopeptide (TPR) repeat protein